MENKIVGHSTTRWDAMAKVTGKAKFTGDYFFKNLLHGKYLRSTIAHGYVKEYDLSEAEKVEGVIKILLPEDVPQNFYSTAGHPWSLNPDKRDIQDRSVLTRNVRQYGEEIGAVIATTELAAITALEKIKVIYDEYPVYLTPKESMADGARRIHAERENIIANTCVSNGDIEKGLKEADYVIEESFSTPVQQHAHMENQIAIAYLDEDQRWTCISSTQIPHICRRVIGQALGVRWSTIRVKKPFIGGGFGNKQDITIEPLAVAMSMACGGRPVQINITREESLAYTRTRHAIDYTFKVGVKKDGTITAIDCEAISNQGAYASHGHSVGGKGGGFINALYKTENIRYAAKTVYTNIGVAGAMRGYGIPQVMYALEAVMEDVARKIGMDSIEFRIKNKVPEGTYNELTRINIFHNKLDLCLKKGKEQFKWDQKLALSKQHKSGPKRRGVGVASFSYGSGTYPFGLEVAGARIILIQDGSFKLLVGATEIGQGSDTVFSQMVAETIGVPAKHIITEALTDTDIAPFDTGSYASRQSYITGFAVKEAAEEMRMKILTLASRVHDLEISTIDIVDSNIVFKHNQLLVTTLADLAMISFYDQSFGKALVAESAVNIHQNSYAYGATFAEVEVDIETGEIDVLSVLNVHDSGEIINPQTAEGQVHGGMVMGLALGLSEGLRYSKEGKPLNNNLLDYKMPTTMDMPDLEVAFVIDKDPIGPYGNKSLGENPLCSPAGAIRNAVLDATGVAINHIPLATQTVYEQMKQAKLRD
ncbi:xanthine dehydrogenase subunit XdhA [Enterococcus rivorum]|uniref:Xanthine dehydrogenase molybdenum-binding subunit XdhA n=1 Tax=Enterococcus rivorum TaxID=762845 RepID=A0A1E5KSF8_9ENTE|nr:xanthine dehydrogenase subunit XdhA [Enterococcus rivorum]MBP2098265.1 xanthine dehydrogenase molybdenum-binding subunit [Enterococcus rivorum]OEH80817.1 xanthine dehydrogenase molybdenum-binding subunit XdhA [Enterococcus rivorum]